MDEQRRQAAWKRMDDRVLFKTPQFLIFVAGLGRVCRCWIKATNRTVRCKKRETPIQLIFSITCGLPRPSMSGQNKGFMRVGGGLSNSSARLLHVPETSSVTAGVEKLPPYLILPPTAKQSRYRQKRGTVHHRKITAVIQYRREITAAFDTLPH